MRNTKFSFPSHLFGAMKGGGHPPPRRREGNERVRSQQLILKPVLKNCTVLARFDVSHSIMTGHAQAVSPIDTEDIKTRCNINCRAAEKILLHKGHCVHFSL